MSIVKRVLIAAIALGAAATAHAQPIADPFAHAREGMVACYSPDTAAKTCRGIHNYVFNSDGSVTVIGTASLQDAPSLTLRISSVVRVRDDGVVCGPQQASDLENATFEYDGAPASPELTQSLRADLLAALSSRFGEACSTHTQTGDTVSVTSTLNGRPLPNVNEMIWVRPTDGYVLRGP